VEPIFARFAERYAKQGFPVFPLLPNCKKPIYGSKEGQNTGGFHQATTNLSTVRYWATLHPTANIGIRTGKEGGFSAIDIDPKNYGFETERGFRNEGKVWPETAVVRTKSGGRHIWLAYHPALEQGQDRLGKGIDIRNDGGYVVGPGSVVDGKKYQFLNWPKTGLASAPQWVLDHLETKRIEHDAKLTEKAKNTVKVDPARLTVTQHKRYAGLAASALKRLEDRLVHKRRPGRNAELYTVTCFMAPYVRGGFISEATVRSAFEDASKRNGLVAENGIKDVRNTIDDAFRLSTDGLPDLSKLEDRPFERRAAA
jgi:hypothetical protein